MFFLIIIKIFFARIVDVSLGTFRTILTVKGRIYLPTLIAFFEVIIWFYVAKEALLVKTSSPLIPISYASGYATGNMIGSLISKYLINIYYEVKIYSYNNKIEDYLNQQKVKYFIVENNLNHKLIITYLDKKSLYKRINDIHKLSKKCIIYINEARKKTRFTNINKTLN